MTDFRALCVELVDCLEKADWPLRYRYVFRQWIDIARAALSDEPAVPEGREPAAVTGQPSDEELLELWQGWNLGWDPQKGMVLMPHPAEYARAVLARWGHQPAPPAEGEVAELVRLLGSMAAEAELADQVHDASVLDRAADLLQRLSPPQPVPVSELSPVAQAVLDSTMGLAATVREAQAVAAAALRAAVDQVVPETMKPDDTLCCPPIDTIVWKRLMNVRQQFLAISAELENADDH